MKKKLGDFRQDLLEYSVGTLSLNTEFDDIVGPEVFNELESPGQREFKRIHFKTIRQYPGQSFISQIPHRATNVEVAIINPFNGEVEGVVKEEVESLKSLEEASFKVGDRVKPNIGPHKGQTHEIIHDHGDGSYNIKPVGLKVSQIRYKLGAAKATASQLVKEDVESIEESTKEELQKRLATLRASQSYRKAKGHDSDYKDEAEIKRIQNQLKSMKEDVESIDEESKQKPYVSSAGGVYRVLGNRGQVKATFSKKEHGPDAQQKAQAHLEKHYDEYLKEEVVEVDEAAPPGKDAEDFIKANKDDFKKRYGDKWEEILYATAWKKFGKSESLEEAATESGEGNVTILKSIVKDKTAKTVKFANGQTTKVDLYSASVLVKLYDAINDTNKKTFENAINKSPTAFMKILDFAMSKVK